MAGTNWSRVEVEAIVADYFEMLALELAGKPYNKTKHRQFLAQKLEDRSPQSMEFKHANISAVLIGFGFPFISGYKPRFNYQKILPEIVADFLKLDKKLVRLVERDVAESVPVPAIDDFGAVETDAPIPIDQTSPARCLRTPLHVNYLELEARNRQLGLAGEEFVINYERVRLRDAGKHKLASRIEHVSIKRGDSEGFDILSFETTGAERFIEVKTTKYGKETPFFVSSNEVSVSERNADRYHLCRVFDFRVTPRLFTLHGSLSSTCLLAPSTYLGRAGSRLQ